MLVVGKLASYLPPEANQVLISTNPKAGARSGRAAVERLARLLRQRGFTVEILSDLEQLSSRSAALHAAGALRAVVAAGGDGTAAMVVNRTQPGTPIMVLPLGTENLLSKYIGVTSQPESVCQTIRVGLTVQLDAGQAGGRIFLLMLSCGFDAEVIRRLHHQRRGHIDHLSYLKPIFDSLRSYEYPQLRVDCGSGQQSEDGSQRKEVTASWVFVVNLPRYAIGLSIVPDAVGTDGLLDVCTFAHGSFWHGLMYLSGIILGQHQSWDDCVMTRSRRVRVESDGQVPYQLDGDPGGFLPVEIEILPQRLTLVVPESWAAQQGFAAVRKMG